MPPTKPTLPVFDAIAASMPTRNEPSCSLNSTDCTLGRLTIAVDDRELRLGKFLRDLLDRIGLGEADADDRVLAALGEAAMRLLELGLVGGDEFGVVDAGLLLEALGAVGDASLKDLSNLPPRSKTIAGLTSSARAGAAANIATPETAAWTMNFMSPPFGSIGI